MFLFVFCVGLFTKHFPGKVHVHFRTAYTCSALHIYTLKSYDIHLETTIHEKRIIEVMINRVVSCIFYNHVTIIFSIGFVGILAGLKPARVV